MKTFESIQEFKSAIEDVFNNTKGFYSIECPLNGLEKKFGNRKFCFATKLQPSGFIKQVNERLEKFSEMYSPWTEDYAITFAAFRSFDKKYSVGFSYVPKNVGDYIEKGKSVDLKFYPPLKEFTAYLSIIVETDQK